ncbi:MAG: PTS sugar transporter subunit IIA [Kiritimatiellae bacterium]|nr:PTS sugar transporter subunit IIA [Kiritimatiellia bacterium]
MNESSPDLPSLLSATLFVPAVGATDKPGVLGALADAAVAGGAVDPARRDDVLRALLEREEKMSTGMQYGLAIPHAKTDCVARLVTLVALAPAGVPFDSLDGEPATVFIATLSPPEDANSHIRFLALVTRQLNNRRVREKVLAAKTKDELVAAFSAPA